MYSDLLAQAEPLVAATPSGKEGQCVGAASATADTVEVANLTPAQQKSSFPHAIRPHVLDTVHPSPVGITLA